MLSFLIPFRTDHAERERNWQWVRRRLELIAPNSEIVVGESPDGPFNPSAAVNDAASRAKGDTFCVHDADCIMDKPGWYADARERDGWSVPEGSRYLNPISTEMVVMDLALGCVLPAEKEVEFSVGGIVMMPRETFFEVQGKDERFEGWGPEDAAFATALWTLGGPRHRFGGPLTHLWHPTEGDARPWPPGSDELWKRYERASDDPEAMRKVLAR